MKYFFFSIILSSGLSCFAQEAKNTISPYHEQIQLVFNQIQDASIDATSSFTSSDCQYYILPNEFVILGESYEFNAANTCVQAKSVLFALGASYFKIDKLTSFKTKATVGISYFFAVKAKPPISWEFELRKKKGKWTIKK